jgi:hypothetical protein
MLFTILACQLTPLQSSSSSNLNQTQTALSMTLTSMNASTSYNQPTSTPINPLISTPVAITEPAAQTIQEKINSSNILIYEDIVGDPDYIPYVAKAVASFGGTHVYVGDAMGTFMDDLGSNTKWDLIIVADELRGAISGAYWTNIENQIDNNHAAVIAEVWDLDQIGNGKIKPLLDECGVEVQGNWERPDNYNPLDYAIYWSEPNSPVFNTPNQVANFNYSLQDAWLGDAGDFLELTPGSNATILASHGNKHKTDYGVLTSCLGGTVLFQTFSSHDYPSDAMIALWQNYISYTLTNHFQTTP